MQVTDKGSAAVEVFPLRLTPSVRKQAEELSHENGVDLNQFINRAVEHVLAQIQNDQWLATRPKPDAARTARAIRDNGNEPDPGDELPEGYVSIRFSPEYEKLTGAE